MNEEWLGGLSGGFRGLNDWLMMLIAQKQRAEQQKKTDEDRQFQRLGTLAGLRREGVVPASESQATPFEIPNVTGGGMAGGVGAAASPLPSSIPAAARYKPFGEAGGQSFVLDTFSTPDARERNKAALEEIRRRANLAPQRTYDAERGVIVDEAEGRAIPVQGLPGKPTKPLSEAQVAAQENRRLDRTRDLRGDYQKDPVVKNAYEIARVASGIKAALQGDAPMDDLSIIYETVKLFDPGSVVREGEIRLMQSAASIPLQLRLTIERWNKGRLLTPGMRAHIANLVDRKVMAAQQGVAPVQSEFGRMAREFGVQSDSSYIAPDPFRGVQVSKRSRLPNQE